MTFVTAFSLISVIDKLSIDSVKYQLIESEGVFKIEISIKSEKKLVQDFLNELHQLIDSYEFDIDRNFFLIRTAKTEECYSTPYTLLDLEYDSQDVVDRLRELTVEDYSETLFDKDDENPPLLFVFGKQINGKEIYIKLKIKRDVTKKILCVSFHYAKYVMKHPYA